MSGPLVTRRLSMAVALLAFGPLAAQAQPGFPVPSGKFQVGRIEIDITDASRDEIFTDDPADKRRLLVTLYYPAVAAADTPRAPYGTPELAAASPFFGDAQRRWLSPAYEDVAVADGQFPVLVFSPGLDSLTLYYTSLLSELASRGFVVAALWHSYSTEVVAFPDGTVLGRNAAGGLGGPPADQQAVRLTRLGDVWVADQRFVLDQLAVWNEQHALLQGRLDLQRIGALGHSLGGAAAVEAARIDERIDAAINMDGGMFGGVVTEGSRVPFLLIHSDFPVPTDADLQQLGITREQADALLKSIMDERVAILARSSAASAQTLEGATHNAFMTDFLFFSTAMPAAARAALVGDVDPTAAFGHISRWIAEFLSLHLAQEPDSAAIEAATRDSERLADCITRRDTDCMTELTQVSRGLMPFGSGRDLAYRYTMNTRVGPYRDFAVSRPGELFTADDGQLVTFVPYFESRSDDERRQSVRLITMAYMVGLSDDHGETWGFVPVNNSWFTPAEVDLVFPEARSLPRPDVVELEVSQPEYGRSSWLQTTRREFVHGDGAIAYALKLKVRREIVKPLLLTIRYDNPAEVERSVSLQSSLPPGRLEIEWQSPALTGFELGETYDVVIAASDPDTGEQIFEHREALVFLPTVEMWRSHMAEAPVEQPN